jgi:methylmalonyl-CoA mutase
LEKSTFDKSKTKGRVTIRDNDFNKQSHQLSSPSLSLHSVNGCIYYDGSKSITKELASVLFCFHQRIEYYLSDSDRNKSVEDDLHISIHLDDIYLLNIAKIRALKKLYARLLEAYSLPSGQLKIKGSIAPQSMGQNVNMNRIKASSIALSAVSGGIDSLELYNDGLIDVNSTEEYNRRIARNINHILVMEGYLDRVVDPAAGSYYLEFLTDTLAKESWTLFQNKWRETN